MRPLLFLAALLLSGAVQAQIDTTTMNIEPPKMARDKPLVLCVPPAAATVGRVLRYREGYRMQVTGIVSEEAIAAMNAVGVALMFAGGGAVTYCKGNTVRVTAIPVPGFPAPPQYAVEESKPSPTQPVPVQPVPSEASGTPRVQSEKREVE